MDCLSPFWSPKSLPATFFVFGWSWNLRWGFWTFWQVTQFSCVSPHTFLLLFSCSVISNSVATPWTVANRLLCPWDSRARILKWVAISFFREFSHPGMKPICPALRADSLPLSHWGTHYFYMHMSLKLVWFSHVNLSHITLILRPLEEPERTISSSLTPTYYLHERVDEPHC